MNTNLQKIFRYLERTYIPYNSLPTLEMSGNSFFRSHVFEPLQKEIAAALTSFICQVSL
jgi:hypothetical protein